MANVLVHAQDRFRIVADLDIPELVALRSMMQNGDPNESLQAQEVRRAFFEAAHAELTKRGL